MNHSNETASATALLVPPMQPPDNQLVQMTPAVNPLSTLTLTLLTEADAVEPAAVTEADSALLAPEIMAAAAAGTAEAQLIQDVDALWKAHSQAKSSLRQSQKEMKRHLADLSERLYELKAVSLAPR